MSLHDGAEQRSQKSGDYYRTTLWTVIQRAASEEESPLFLADDFVNVESLAAKLTGQTDRLSAWLFQAFSETARSELKAALTAGQPRMLRRSLATALNLLMRREVIFEQGRFEGIRISDQSRRLLRQAGEPTVQLNAPTDGEGGAKARSEGEDLVLKVNRSLLEDAYPHELMSWRCGGERREAAAATLVERYKGRILGRLKQKGIPDAEELCDRFIADVFFPKLISIADPAKGRFRALLGTALSRFILDRLRWMGRQPLIIPLTQPETDSGEDRVMDLPDGLAPEAIEAWCDRLVAEEIFERAQDAVRAQFVAERKQEEFDVFNGADRGAGGVSYAVLAEQWGISEGAVKVRAHRFRRAFRDALLREVRELSPPGEAEEELRYLLRILSRER